MPDKTDFKKEFKQFYMPSKTAEIVEVPPFQFLMIDGMNAEPESEGFQSAIEALFGVSYKVKFLSKKALSKDYTVMPLEGLWWADDMDDFVKGNKRNWQWTLMIFQPEFIRQDLIDEAIQAVKQKKDNASLDHLRLETYQEGPSAQILHIGPYSEEYDNIQKLHHLIEEKGGVFDGHDQRHHEIYLSDFRKTAPEKLKTVIRQPFVLK